MTGTVCLTIAGVNGQTQVEVLCNAKVAEVKEQAGTQLGMNLETWGTELVLLDTSCGCELKDADTVDGCKLDDDSILILVQRELQIYTGGGGCYGLGPDGSFTTVSPNALTSDEILLRRVNDEEYPWVVNGFEIPGLRFGLFQTLPSNSAGRLVCVDLKSVRKLTQSYCDQMAKVYEILGQPNAFDISNLEIMGRQKSRKSFSDHMAKACEVPGLPNPFHV